MSDSLIVRSSLKDNFSVLPNHLLNDDRLSADQLGLLAYLLSKPTDWQVQVTELRKRFDVGRDKIRTILACLEQYGYITKEQVRLDGKFATNRYVVSDSPLTEKPSTEKPSTANPTLNKDRSKQRTEYTKGNIRAKKEKTLFCEWQPTDADREKLVTYCNSHGHELDDILEDMRLWDDANGNQAKYACHSSAVMRWCRTSRKEGKRTQRRSNRQQSVSKPKGKGELSDRQKQYAETVAEKMWNAYKAEGFYYKMILPDIIAFMQTDQTDADWSALGNGMDNPIERGWM